MSERKYRQRGYQDDDRHRERTSSGSGSQARPDRPPGAPAATRRLSSEGAKNPKMMGYHTVARCARCAGPVEPDVLPQSTCRSCGQALHACIQCQHFDPGARFECTQRIAHRVAPKDAANECTLFVARTSLERETSSSSMPSSETSARKAFDDLFNF